MPRPTLLAPPLHPGTTAAPAPIEQLGWWLLPAHVVLALLVLQPYFAPLHPLHPLTNPTFGGPESVSPLLWVAAALVTGLFAARPLLVGTRRDKRRSRVWVGFSMVGWGYVNMLVCLAFRSVGEQDGDAVLGMVMLGAAFGLPSAVMCTVPFALLDLPLLSAALKLDGPATFEDRDALLRMVGLHALAVCGLTYVYGALLGAELLRTDGARRAAWLLGGCGLLLVLEMSRRLHRRRRFLKRCGTHVVDRDHDLIAAVEREVQVRAAVCGYDHRERDGGRWGPHADARRGAARAPRLTPIRGPNVPGARASSGGPGTPRALSAPPRWQAQTPGPVGWAAPSATGTGWRGSLRTHRRSSAPPFPATTLRIEFAIMPDGEVVAVTATENTVSPGVGECVLAVIDALTFSPGPTGGFVRYRFPFVFVPGG